jgi:predicted HTH domain antitoxin
MRKGAIGSSLEQETNMATLIIEYPDELLVSLKETKEGLTRELKLAAAVKLYEIGKLSSGKAAKLAGMDRVSFLKTLGKYRVSISTVEEVEEDVRVDISSI